MVLRVERWVEESIMDLCDRLESAWRERSNECVDWVRDCGSLVVRELRGRVVSRERYVFVVGSLELGSGRGDGLSK